MFHPHVDPMVRLPAEFKLNIRTNEFKTFLIAALRQIENPERITENIVVLQSFVKYAASYLENSVKKDQKINKLDVLLSVFQVVCPGFSETHRVLVKGMVEFLLANGDIRKKPLKFFSRRLVAGLKVATLGPAQP